MYIQNMYINGEWISCREELEVRNPATLEVIGSIPRGGADAARQAADAAYAALASWSALTANERAGLLMKWHALIEAHTQELAQIMTAEQGKPLKEAAGEIGYANSFVSWYAEEGKRVYGQTIPASSPNKRIWVHKQLGRRHRGNYPVEFPGVDDHAQGRSGAGRRMHGRAQTVGGNAVYGLEAGPVGRTGGHSRGRIQCRDRGCGSDRRSMATGRTGPQNFVHGIDGDRENADARRG